MAQLQRLGHCADPLDDRIENRIVRIDTGSRRTDLAGIGEDGQSRARDGGRQVGVLENDDGGFAAELERYSLQVAARRIDNLLSRGYRARERNLVDSRMPRKRIAG